MSDSKLLEYCGTDAMRWAEKFSDMEYELRTIHTAEEPLDSGWLVGWFANAMCMAEEARREKDEQIAIEAIGRLSGLLASVSGAWDGEQPEWLPQPPEWLDLWYKCIAAVTADEKASDYQDIQDQLENFVNILRRD